MPTRVYCINLKDRVGKMESYIFNWNNILPIIRVDAVDGRVINNGALGCFNSHLKVLNEYDHKNEHVLITEDDAVPCDDFMDRLNNTLKDLPKDWNILMLGYWPMPGNSYSKISDNLFKAHNKVLATHCYLVNNSFLPMLKDVFDIIHNKHMDRLFNALEDTFNVYMAYPSLSYQGGSFSDTSNTGTDYEGTKVFYKQNLNS
jgi:GR25 family glycosyltransferase involved in LPS biosynthesis